MDQPVRVVADAPPEQAALAGPVLRTAQRSHQTFVRLALLTSDLLMLLLCVGAMWLAVDAGDQIISLVVIIPVWFALTGFYGLYHRDRVGADNATLDEIWPIFHCITVASWLVFVGTQITGLQTLHGGHVVGFWLLAVIALPTGRSITRIGLRRRTALKQNAVVVGAGLVGQEIARKIMRQPSYGLELVGLRRLPIRCRCTTSWPTCPCSGRRRSWPTSSRPIAWSTSSWPSPPTTRPAWTSFASATSSACRWTSCPACSRSLAAAPPSTRSRAPRCSAWRRRCSACRTGSPSGRWTSSARPPG